MRRPKGRLYDMNIEDSILADFDAEWGLCLRHAILIRQEDPFFGFVANYFYFHEHRGLKS
jgi:hypothetical protein